MEPRKKIALIALLVIFGIAMLGDVLLTWHYLNNFAPNPAFDYFLSLGLLIAQPCLLSIWCALGSQKLIVRIPAAMGMLAVLTIVYLSLLVSDGAPAEVTFVLAGCAIALTLLIQVPAWIFRASTKLTIVLPTETKSSISSSQYGIKHLMISTAIAAIVVTVAQANAPHISSDQSGVPWLSLILFLAFFIIVASILSFLILAVVFNQKRRLIFAILLMVILLAAPLASLEVLRSVINASPMPGPNFQWTATEAFNAFCFFFALAAGIMSVLFIFYGIGFRLLKIKSLDCPTEADLSYSN